MTKTNKGPKLIFKASKDQQAIPEVPDIEDIVIGQFLLQSKEVILQASDLLSIDSFYNEVNKAIYSAIMYLYEQGSVIDIITVINRLKQTDQLNYIGGPHHITQLTGRVASAANVRHHALILKEYAVRRKLIAFGGYVQGSAYDPSIDVFTLLEYSQKENNKISTMVIKGQSESAYEIGNQVLKDIDTRIKSGTMPGVTSGFKNLDDLTHGWQKTNLMLVAGRPGMGKTAFALNCARNAAIAINKPVAIFSLEMSSKQLMQRLISTESGVPMDKMKNPKNLTQEEFNRMGKAVGDIGYSIILDDEGGLNVFELRAKCRRLKAEQDVQMIIIDYLQLIRGSDNYIGMREQEISEVSRTVKQIGKELNIPIMALSQLSRATETRGGDKKPHLSDLRESGSLEQDADVVLFLYRPDYYGFKKDAEGNDTTGIAQIIIAKQRDGETDVTALLKFNPSISKFTNFNQNLF